MFLPVLCDVESGVPGVGFDASLAFKLFSIQFLLDFFLLLGRNTLGEKFVKALLHDSINSGSVFGQSLLQRGKLALVQPEFDRNRVHYTTSSLTAVGVSTGVRGCRLVRGRGGSAGSSMLSIYSRV